MTDRWRALANDQRQAAGAAVALVLAMFLPWYQTSSPAVVAGRPQTVKDSLSAFEVFTWVEAAVLLVAAAVLYLLDARARRRAFHLPGGDGWAVTLAGAWVLLLLLWRLFDKPDVDRAAVGIAWGIFVAAGLAVALAAAGQRIRAAGHPEPPNPMAETEELWERPRRRRESDRPRRPADHAAVTEVLRDRPPAWEGEPPEAPGRATPGRATPDPGTPGEPQPDPPPDRLF